MAAKTALACAVLSISGWAAASDVYFEYTGHVSGAMQSFTQSPAFSGQRSGVNESVAAEAELYWEWGDGSDSLTFVPFARYDSFDDERTHADVRELVWGHFGESYELKAGLSKVFWGVTEFQHLADVINQTDGVDSATGEAKLGQPMISLSFARDSGIYDVFVLPGFRERTFAGVNGRFRSGLAVAADAATYESADENEHIDYALRWSNSLDLVDVGAYWFSGTSRDPSFSQQVINGESRLVPHYELIDQVGIDVQATLDSWLWKLETIWRDSASDTYLAAQGGVEYSFYGVFDSFADLGVLVEYGWDERGTDANVFAQNDVFFGSRLVLNDEASSEALIGVSTDLDFGGASLTAEASTRLGSSWTVALESQFFMPDSDDTVASNFSRDDYIQLEAKYYF